MSSSDELNGVCLGCGTVSMALRFDKKGRPYCSCKRCGTRIFTPLEGAPTRWLAILLVLAADQGWHKAFEDSQGRVRAWMQRAYADRVGSQLETVPAGIDVFEVAKS